MFLNWLNNKSNHKLWITGTAGAGKPVLASLAIDAVHQNCSNPQESPTLYFFCDNTLQDSQNICVIIGSLIYQLANNDPEALVSLQQLHSARSNSSMFLKGSNLDDLRRNFRDISAHFHDITVIIDGLDECADFREISRELARLPDDDVPTKVFVFSRDESEIRDELEPTFTVESILANNDDIKLYIASQIQCREDFTEFSQEVKDAIRDKLAKGAHGV